MNQQPDTSRPGMELTPEMVAACGFLFDPVAWGERMLINRDGTPRRYRDYQALDLRCTDKRIVHLDGRSVGKTVNLSTLLLYFTFVNQGKSVLVAAPYQGQLDQISEEVEFQLGHNELLRNNVLRKSGGGLQLKHHPYFEVTFQNGCSLYFRPAGEGGTVFRGLHVDLLLVDEAAWFTKRAWSAIRQCLKAEGTFRVYSTPNGLRTTPYYEITHSKRWRCFRWPSWLAPDWSAEREQDLLDFYGGRNTPDWQHEVAGQHGAPTYGAFIVPHVVRALVDLPDYRRVDIPGEVIDGLTSESEVRDRLETLLGLGWAPARCWLGGDLGYTSDPTELLLFDEDVQDGTLSLILRVHCERLPYPAITELIGVIDQICHPVGIGLDRGGNGTGVEQQLLRSDKFRGNHFDGRLVGYDFGGSLEVGEDKEGRPIKKRIKEQMTLEINKALAANRLRLPKEDTEIMDQLCSQTYVQTDHGIVYSKGNDHIVDAMRCALLRCAQETDSQYEPTVVVPPFFMARVRMPWDD